jgi:hypothetical protein
MNQPLELQLLRRLTFLGFILFACALVALLYDFLPATSDEMYLLEEEIEEAEPLNPYFVSAVFASIGATCLFISWKKRKTSSQKKDPE